MAAHNDFFAGDGKIRALLRARDWTDFSLGAPDSWPGPLKTAIQLMLDSTQPASLMWGPQLYFFYNEAYTPILGKKHPSALTLPFWEVWPEVRQEFEPEMERALAGVSCQRSNVPFRIRRHGHLEQTWFTFSLLPIRNDDGKVSGIFNPAVETTREVESARRRAFQLELLDRLRPLAAPEEIIATTSEMLGRQLGVSRVMYCEIDEANGSFFVPRDWTSNDLPSIAGEQGRLDDFGPEIIATLRAGNPMLVDDVTTDPRTARHAAAYAGFGVRASLAISLVKSGRMTIALSLQHVKPRHWTESEVQLSQDMAERTWAAVENARAQAQLRAERDQNQHILDTMTEGFAMLDRNWTVLRMNAEGLRISQRTAAQVIGRGYWDIWPETIGSELECLYRRVMETRSAGTLDCRTPFANDQATWIETRVYPGLDGGLAIFNRDITERKQAEERFQEASQHDNLTGLPNRRFLHEYCSHILPMSARSGEPGAILFIDLDRFKPINDLYGHMVGDKVLQEVARRLLACTRKESIVSRLGGDEFIVVLPRIEQLHDPAAVAQHILETISQPMTVDTLQLTVSPSIGISLFPQHASVLEQLIRCADMAMYAAKKNGRNNFRIYSDVLNKDAAGMLRRETLLRQALESDRLALVYQPILDMQSRDLAGTEALVRIPSEDGSLLGPMEFIAVAEAAGLMNRIEQWVVREACRQHREWRKLGLPPIPIAVNVAPTQFRQPGFLAVLADAIQEFSIDADCLQLEVTESAVMDNVPKTVATLNQLRAMGIGIVLDDFGTGFSSVSHLGSLPLDKLKIDRSFIRQMTSSPASRSIAEAIIALGRTLKLKVIGEGIESQESMEFLRHYGCDQVQGYLFSKPLPAHEFAFWYQEHLAHTH